MSINLRHIIRKEIRARRDLTGTVLQQRELVSFEVGGGAPVWVARVDIGTNRPLDNVLIKGGSSGVRFFAERGQSVLLRLDAQGRYYIVGPAARLTGATVKKTYALGVATPATSATLGFQFIRDPFEFYENIGNPGASRWNDGVTPFPSVRVLDQAGNPV